MWSSIRLGVAFATLTIALSQFVSCGAGDTPRADEARWEPVPEGPLSPRRAALGVWTGTEVLIIGGHRGDCMPGAAIDCPAPAPDERLLDGAAFDPDSLRWRRIADAPSAIRDVSSTAVLDGNAFFWSTGTAGGPDGVPALIQYDSSEDRWGSVPLPGGASGDAAQRSLTAVDGRLLAYLPSHEQGRSPDLFFDPATGAWTMLPTDPLSPGFDRAYLPTPRGLVLLDSELVPNPGVRPTIQRTAILDVPTGRWRVTPPADLLAGPGLVVGQRYIVRPILGGADGGAVNGWGRTVPFGGVLDLESGTWSTLPEPVPPLDEGGAGALSSAAGTFTAWSDRGWLLDVDSNRWVRLPSPPHEIAERTIVSAGPRIFVFGGVVPSGKRGRPTSAAEVLDLRLLQ